MRKEKNVIGRRLKKVHAKADLVVIGGGMAGCCAAITAARAGIKVILVTDRPVLGGNASSEVRLWILGATSHMGNNNRWAREGGVIDELLTENTYRNPEGNTILFDALLLEKVTAESRISLFLNTSVYEVEKGLQDEITLAIGFCSQNSTTYYFSGRMFCDASGDGVVGFLAGAAFRMGAEGKQEFGEKFAPERSYGELLGHSIYFYTKDVGRPVKYIPPTFALQDITQIPRYRNFKTGEDGCRLWWLEYGGRLDTIHDTEQIKWELWKVVYGVWNHIKNSGNFPEAENLTLEWVGTIPGKRESRRFEGAYMLHQQDVVEQVPHEDAVAFGGWSLDLHPADGVYSEKPGCNQWHSKGIYYIPYRCLYAPKIKNLFLAGRIISASHVAFASTRVMGTCAATGQAVGMAAAIAVKRSLWTHALSKQTYMRELQMQLWRTGHDVPGIEIEDYKNVARYAGIEATSELELTGLPANGPWIPLQFSSGQMLPANGKLPGITLQLKAEQVAKLDVELRISSKAFNHTPDVTLEKKVIELTAGEQEITLNFAAEIPERQYAFICVLKNDQVAVRGSMQRVTGLLSVFNGFNKAVSNTGKQAPTEDIGVDTFEFWCPQRRPAGHNLAFKLSEPLEYFQAENIHNTQLRPVKAPNAWVAAFDDEQPALHLRWAKPELVRKVTIVFDADYDHPMESSLMGHPERVMPFCVRNYRLRNEEGRVLFSKQGNYLGVNHISLPKDTRITTLTLEVEHPDDNIPAAVFDVRCYA